MAADTFDFKSAGGKRIYLSPEGDGMKAKSRKKGRGASPGRIGGWDFGWIRPEKRTPEQAETHAEIVGAWPKFEIQGKTTYPQGRKVLWTDLWQHEKVKAALGFAFPGIHQQTGSCVGAGGGNSLFTSSIIEVLMGGEAERLTVPFWLLPYGRSRLKAGMRGKGQGSFGSAFAWVMANEGYLPADTTGLPGFQQQDGLTWGAQAEMTWSAGDAIGSQWLTAAKPHTFQTFAQVRSADAVRDALVNGYVPTCASMWGMKDPREATVQGGSEPVLIGRRTGSWSHQMSIQGWWDHPTLGELFFVLNQWGDCYPSDPASRMKNGVWVAKADVDWICRDEVFVPSALNAFPAREFSWLI